MTTPINKSEEYARMKNEGQRTIEVVIPNGPKTSWVKCWDFKDDLKHVSFKTLTPPTLYPYPAITFVEVNLMPAHNVTFWHVTIKRI